MSGGSEEGGIRETGGQGGKRWGEQGRLWAAVMAALCGVGALCLCNNLAAEADDHWQLERWCAHFHTTAVQIAAGYPLLLRNNSSLFMSEPMSLLH